MLRISSGRWFGPTRMMHAINYTLATRTPERIVSPADAEELAATLQAAATTRQAVVPWGGGTRQHIGAPPARYDIALDLRGLNRIIEYSPADLVITVEAGATLGATQEALAAHGQSLPWDPPLPARATLGGLLASGAAGPLRLGYGAPRDWILGMRVALGDGRLIHSGAKVVKNVAGYDAHKLHLGALGTLGVIAEITFKVAPLPAERHTLLAVFAQHHAALQAVEQLRAAPLQPIALVAFNRQSATGFPALASLPDGPVEQMLVAARFAGTAGAVQRQVREATRRCVEGGAHTIELACNDDDAFWATLADLNAPTGDGSLLVRVGAPSSALPALAAQIERAAPMPNQTAAQFLLAGVGIGYTRWDTRAIAPTDVNRALGALRAAVGKLGGYAVVEEVPPTLAGPIDRWGPAPAAFALMQTLRNQWDPAQVINPGRYLVP
jgi:glycolate oxidase FAD binding subunit